MKPITQEEVDFVAAAVIASFVNRVAIQDIKATISANLPDSNQDQLQWGSTKNFLRVVDRVEEICEMLTEGSIVNVRRGQ